MHIIARRVGYSWEFAGWIGTLLAVSLAVGLFQILFCTIMAASEPQVLMCWTFSKSLVQVAVWAKKHVLDKSAGVCGYIYTGRCRNLPVEKPHSVWILVSSGDNTGRAKVRQTITSQMTPAIRSCPATWDLKSCPDVLSSQTRSVVRTPLASENCDIYVSSLAGGKPNCKVAGASCFCPCLFCGWVFSRCGWFDSLIFFGVVEYFLTI